MGDLRRLAARDKALQRAEVEVRIAAPRGDQDGDRLALGVGEAHDDVRLQREPEGADAGGQGGGNLKGGGELGGHGAAPRWGAVD